MTLPAGTVTFLFTDIEGSTKLWESQPDAMQIALERHDALLREAIERHNGYVFKTMGDAFCAAFSTAPEALEAALTAQQSLHQIKAGVGSDLLRVRMALHTGAAELRNDDYFGQPLNRVARLLAAGNGGQVLVSQATYILVRDRLPKHTSLKDMGEHRLRDLQRSEQVYQLLHPALPIDFPPLRSLDNPQLPNNLPRQLTSFIGREKEMAEIEVLLQKASLLTLTGSGGCGKTRLSLQIAAEVLEQYTDGVWLVELAALSDAGLVPQTVAQVLNVREAPGEPITKTLLSALRDKQMLLVLDNCEHLLDASAHLVDAVIRGCPTVKVLASSREGLGIAGEQAYRVPSLSLPDTRKAHTPDGLSQYEAARLFTDRAAAARADFGVTADNASVLASVCLRLDGIPLAIELAAARVRSLTVAEINQRLEVRFSILTGGSKTAQPRQQTLRSMIDWSYDLLTGQEQILFMRLSVFAGGWTLEAAEAVCAAGVAFDRRQSAVETSPRPESRLPTADCLLPSDVLDLLTSLVDKSLVVAEDLGDTTRYRLLETVRQYARDRLMDGGDGEMWRDRHLAHFLALAQECEPQLKGTDQQMWMQRLEDEHGNLRAALDWSAHSHDGAETGLRLSGAVWWFWYMRGHLFEGRERIARTLAAGASAPPTIRVKAVNGAGNLAMSQGDYAAARLLFEESLAIFREQGNRQGVASSLSSLAIVAYDQGDHAAARPFREESHAIYLELGDRSGIAGSLHNLGMVAQDQGDYAAARELYREALALNRDMGNRAWVANNLIGLGIVAFELGDFAATRELYEESLTVYRELGNTLCIAVSLEAFASLAAREGTSDLAATLWGAAETLREQIGTPTPPNEKGKYDRDVAKARMTLDDAAAFGAAWTKGRAMTMEQACYLALGVGS